MSISNVHYTVNIINYTDFHKNMHTLLNNINDIEMMVLLLCR